MWISNGPIIQFSNGSDFEESEPFEKKNIKNGRFSLDFFIYKEKILYKKLPRLKRPFFMFGFQMVGIIAI